MKRLRPSFTIALATLLLCSGCYTSRTGIGGDPEATLAGAAIGGNVGGLMGGLIGESHHGWHGGYRGSAIGAIVGTLAGAAIGHAVSRNRNEQEDVYVIDIYLSPSVMVESIGPHNGIKYTATLTAGKRIKTGEIVLRVSVADSFGQPYDGQEFSLPTLR